MSSEFGFNDGLMMNKNGNFLNHGVNRYEHFDHIQRSPPVQCNSSGNGNSYSEACRKSPWESSRFGYSISPSDSSSPVSSSPPRCYGQSPDGSIDSIIVGLLQMIDRFGLSPSSESKAPGPEDHIHHRFPHLGTITRNHQLSTEDHRTLQGYVPPLQPLLNLPQPQAIRPSPSPRGRPIPGNPFPIVVQNPRDTLRHTIQVIGNNGAPEDNLCRPWGIACDKEGHIIIADRSNNRIQIYKENGSFVRQFGVHGTGPGQFDRPAGVAVDDWRHIIVADKDNHRIQVLTMEGHFLFTFGEKGSRVGQFNYPWDVATNSQCQIVVSDTRNHRVQLFSPEGIFLRKYGYETVPSMLKHFDSPRGVAFDPQGNVVMTDFNNHRLIIINADFVHAKILECDAGNGNQAFLRPQGLVVDDNGNIIVADSKNHRLQVLDSSGNFKWTFGSYGHIDPDDQSHHQGNYCLNGEMDRPSGVALTTSGRIAVVDFGNNRVLII